MKQRYRRLAASLLLAGFGAAALAQGTPAPAAPGMAPRGEMRGDMREGHGHRDFAQMRQHREERFARRMGMLKQKLAITGSQEGAWNAWTAAMKPPARNDAQRPDREAFERLTTPERIDRMRSLRAEHQARMDSRMNATKTFYAALTPEQQKTFDRISLRLMGGSHSGGRHGGERGEHRHRG